MGWTIIPFLVAFSKTILSSSLIEALRRTRLTSLGCLGGEKEAHWVGRLGGKYSRMEWKFENELGGDEE